MAVVGSRLALDRGPSANSETWSDQWLQLATRDQGIAATYDDCATFADAEATDTSTSMTTSCRGSRRPDVSLANLVREPDLDAIKRREWVERSRQPRPAERRVLVTLRHPCHTIGDHRGQVDTFRSLPPDQGGPARLSLLAEGPDVAPGNAAASRPPSGAHQARARASAGPTPSRPRESLCSPLAPGRASS